MTLLCAAGNIAKEPPSCGGTGSKHWADISVSPTLLQKEPPLCCLQAGEKKRLLLSQGFRDYSERTSQNKTERAHKSKRPHKKPKTSGCFQGRGAKPRTLIELYSDLPGTQV